MSEAPTIDAIFCGAVEIDAAQDREAYLRQACGDDDTLRQRVDKLLEAHAQAGSILDSPPVDLATTIMQQTIDRPGTMIGPYKLLEQIGEGGFGVVYMAEQTEPVHRKVALKIIKPGMDTKQVVTRFEAERQALALMEHPGIARVFDGGMTENGRPYFVMELVVGLPLTRYCDQNQLTTAERLKLFTDVCLAVQHAHHKGIIHRDLKPSNVMVTLHDGRPVPKVIDFGVSKALDQQLTEKTLFTGYGQMVGTPAYMSPEQAEMSGLDLDTRSDVYSLGVLLYELLTGSTPFDNKRLRKAGFAEMMRIIREEEPPKPSTRLTTLNQKTATGKPADAAAQMPPVRGELDWITMKALDKDRRRRYDTAASLAADVERYLNDQTVRACPPTRSYRLRKFARRHKAALGATAAMVALLLGGVAATGWQAVRATAGMNRAIQAEALAEQRLEASQTALEEAETVSGFLTDILMSPRPDVVGGGRNVRVVDLLDQTAERLEAQEGISPDRVARIRSELATTYFMLGLHQQSMALREKVIRHYLDTRGPNHHHTVGANMLLAVAYREVGRPDEALAMHQRVLEQCEKDQDTPDLLCVQAMRHLADSHETLDQHGEALALREQAFGLSKEKLGADHTETYFAMSKLAISYITADRPGEALSLQEQAVALSQRLYPQNHEHRLNARRILAVAYEHDGRLGVAEQIRADILSDMIAAGTGNAIWVLTDFGRTDVADQWITRNDNVMGGRSKGGPAFSEGKLVFTGETVTQNGGFSSIRTKEMQPLNLSFADSVKLRVKGDGRTYKFEMRTTDSASRWNAIPYRADFATQAGEWIEVSIPLSDLKPTLHGFDISERAPALDKTNIRSFGLMIYDKQDGPFRLEVDWIKAVAEDAEPVTQQLDKEQDATQEQSEVSRR